MPASPKRRAFCFCAAHHMTTAVATDSPTLQEAFEAAKAEHSSPERALDAGASTETGTVKGPDEAKTEPPVSDAVTPEISDFLSDEELSSLKAKHGTDADALARDLKAAFTKKTQSLAEQRKSVERLAEHADFIDALQKDPLATIQQVAERMGWNIAPKTAEAQATEHADATIAKAQNGLRDRLREKLTAHGLDFLVDPIADSVEPSVKEAIEEAIKPMKSALKTHDDRAAEGQRDAVLAAFEAKHPDWKAHEASMTKLSARIKPGDGVEPGEYLETLYDLATKDTREAEAVKRHIAKMTQAAKADEGKSHSVADGQVMTARPANPSIREAFEAAKRGERWE